MSLTLCLCVSVVNICVLYRMGIGPCTLPVTNCRM